MRGVVAGVARVPARACARWLAPALLGLCTLSACTQLGVTQGAPSGTPMGTATVVWVIDGDTVDLEIDGERERARLIGIDTPESVSRTDPVQCYGVEASDALTGLLPPDTIVRIERDEEARDRFGRLLLYVHRAEDGLFINRHLVEQGFAEVLFFEPNTAFEVEFTRIRNEARSESRGLWGSCDGPDQPLD